ncbi:MAG: nitroreductase family deazaflavin-dependent oxidoreductase [Pseudonocardiaceae bacterium]
MRWRIPRWLARAPIPVFRRGFGWVLGPRLLLLEHLGRRTKLPRYVVLEVLDHGPGEWYVVAAYGQHAQWLRNVQQHPRVRVWWQRLRGVPCDAYVVDRTEAREHFSRYVLRNPRTARFLARLTMGAPAHLSAVGLIDHLTREARLVCVTGNARAA